MLVAGRSGAWLDALRTLLDATSFNFLTSLAGMILSILCALLRKERLHAGDRNVDQFLAALELPVPLITPISSRWFCSMMRRPC
jgi:hypothetical protein